MIADALFELLDLNHDGGVSRSELHTAAEQFGWGWHEAPLFALLDLLTIRKPLPREQFTAIIYQIQKDPLGPYGKVLLKSPHFSAESPPEFRTLLPCHPLEAGASTNSKSDRDDELIAWNGFKNCLKIVDRLFLNILSSNSTRFIDLT